MIHRNAAIPGPTSNVRHRDVEGTSHGAARQHAERGTLRNIAMTSSRSRPTHERGTGDTRLAAGVLARRGNGGVRIVARLQQASRSSEGLELGSCRCQALRQAGAYRAQCNANPPLTSTGATSEKPARINASRWSATVI